MVRLAGDRLRADPDRHRRPDLREAQLSCPQTARSASAIGTIHRWSGRIAFLCTLPVAFHCIFILGFQTYDTRVLVHSILGTFFYGVFAVKVLVVRDHGLPGWVLPVAGSTLFTVLVLLWSTSSLWYFTNIRVGF